MIRALRRFLMFRLRLKTKLVLAITAIVMAVVVSLSTIYVSQQVAHGINDAYQTGQFVALEVFHSSREALEVDFSDRRWDLQDPKQFQQAVEEILQTDPGLDSLLQSVIGYSPIIYDIGVVDNAGKAIVHNDANLIGKRILPRESFSELRNRSIWQQLRTVYGDPQVYEVSLPLQRNGQTFATIRVGISTVFLKNSLQPRLNRALLIAGLSILFSMVLAAALSNFALRPLTAISRQLDAMNADAATQDKPSRRRRDDEYGIVSSKIERLGQQMRDVKEVFSTLKENLDQIMANLEDGVILLSQDQIAILVSESVHLFLGVPASELTGKHFDQIFAQHSSLRELIAEAFARHERIHGIEVLANRPGTGPARTLVSVDFIEQGQELGALVTLRDAESVKRIEDELEISRRLSAVGRLTSGVAHEVKNPINAIVVHLEVLRQKLQGIDPDARRHMDVIGSEIRRLDRVVQTLVDFTRPVEMRLAELDLRRLVTDVIALAEPAASDQGVVIRSQISPEPLPVKVDADLVKQAVLNVVINGVQAMSQGGTLTIGCSRLDGSAEINVSDQGPGIPLEVREKIFTLYFTTKKNGSGIGLPMTYRVMHMHSGAVEFDSREGQGTTFRLRFPLLERSQEQTSASVERTAVEG